MHPRFEHPVVRWLVTFAWTALVIALMVTPGDEPLVTGLSDAFGDTDLTDAAGHVVLCAVLTILWQWALIAHIPPSHALRIALGVALALGTSVELLQMFVPNRGVSLLDLLANWLGGFIAWACCTKNITNLVRKA